MYCIYFTFFYSYYNFFFIIINYPNPLMLLCTTCMCQRNKHTWCSHTYMYVRTYVILFTIYVSQELASLLDVRTYIHVYQYIHVQSSCIICRKYITYINIVHTICMCVHDCIYMCIITITLVCQCVWHLLFFLILLFLSPSISEVADVEFFVLTTFLLLTLSEHIVPVIVGVAWNTSVLSTATESMYKN